MYCPEWLWVPTAPTRLPLPALLRQRDLHFDCKAEQVPHILVQRWRDDRDLAWQHLDYPALQTPAPGAHHAIDVALSIGRQAVERAYLAGINRLHLAAGMDALQQTAVFDEHHAQSIYAWLCHHGQLELAAWVGSYRAAAQIGI